MYAELPLHEALRALHACGWRAFEVSTEHLAAIETDHDTEGQIERAQRCLHDLGLCAPQAHAYLDADVAASNSDEREKDMSRLLCHTEIAARLGVHNVVMHPGGKHGYTTRAEQEHIHRLNIEAFRRLGDFAGAQAVRIGIENLMCRGASTPSELLELLEAIDHPAIGITLDTSHANVAALDVAKVVRELGPHVVATHISDNDGSGDQHLTPGSGTIDWPAVMDAFREIGYNGLFNLEIAGERHPVPAVRQLKLHLALEVAEWLVALADSQRGDTP